MKKVVFLLATLLIGGMMLTGCKKDPQPTPTPTPTPTTTKVVYTVDNTDGVMFTASDCFKYTITYTGADGKPVTVNDVTLPWTSPEITVTTLPFNAKIEGVGTYKEEELPANICIGQSSRITANGALVAAGQTPYQLVGKARFLELMAQNPDLLKFSLSGEVK